ncbi:VOC family protein [Chryseobacterium sp. JJR-5R]|uniref:VOC family protein n=1 Tax=Chryseobacterium sp. JJR-5R TaxID=3093923 RepID=UPI002A74BD79|nr:VOC family protein [Chryseobacterium sp. JJR-5R]WPO84189.1 VOC family protein [Chryseobacterium sp. JJR-5R]
MKLGAFSISLSVKDLQKSKDFYEKLGFSEMGGAMDQNYVIMKNGDHIIGLFQAMFDGNMLTFNPGWDQNAQNMEVFEDVRDIQRHLKEQGVELQKEADETTSGPEHIYLKDPDGNMILIDQHR